MSIDTSKYKNLGNYGVASREKKSSGPFLVCFITGEPRDNQSVGKMQVMTNLDNGIYIVNNKDSVNFVTMYITKWREKNVSGGPNSWDKTVCFGWGGDAGVESSSGKLCPISAERPSAHGGWCSDCKFVYLIAGLYLDDNMKPVEYNVDPSDPTSEKRKAMIYFKCQGVRYSNAMDYVTKLSDLGKDLKPLSDDPAFEAAVITPKRFITTAKVGLKKTDHGTKYVFDFAASKQIPDQLALKILDLSNDQMTKFEDQFNKTESIKGTTSGSGAGNQQQAVNTTQLSFDDGVPSKQSPDKMNVDEAKAASDLAGDIDFDL